MAHNNHVEIIVGRSDGLPLMYTSLPVQSHASAKSSTAGLLLANLTTVSLSLANLKTVSLSLANIKTVPMA